MTDVLKHRFTSPKLDGGDTQQVQPSHWNDGHRFQGGNVGDVLTRDPTDVSFGAKWTTPYGSVIYSTATGTVNDWAPGLTAGKNVTIFWGGTAPLTITGIAGGVPGQVLTIRNRAGSVLSVAHYSSGSAVGNRMINAVSSAPTPIASQGSATYIYFPDAASWELVAHEQGAWITPPFNAADYGVPPGMTWTVTAGQVLNAKYRLSGRSVHWLLDVRGGVLGGSVNSYFNRAAFGGFTGPPSWSWVSYAFAGTIGSGNVQFVAPAMTFYRDATFATNWVAGAVTVLCNGSYEVN